MEAEGGSEVVIAKAPNECLEVVDWKLCNCGVERWRCQCEVIRKSSDSDSMATGAKGQG